jgi:hypothetical protein
LHSWHIFAQRRMSSVIVLFCWRMMIDSSIGSDLFGRLGTL